MCRRPEFLERSGLDIAYGICGVLVQLHRHHGTGGFLNAIGDTSGFLAQMQLVPAEVGRAVWGSHDEPVGAVNGDPLEPYPWPTSCAWRTPFKYVMVDRSCH